MSSKTTNAGAVGVIVAVVGLVVFGGLRAVDHLRERPPAPPATAAAPPGLDASQPPMPAPPPAVDAGAPDAGRPVVVVELEHATCGVGLFDPDAGLRRLDSDAAVPRPLVSMALLCHVPDAGVAWSYVPVGDQHERLAVLMASMFAAERRSGSARVRQEIVAMDREAAAGGDRWAVPGFLFRAPDRARGRFTRIDGTAHEVAEHDGVTTLTVSIDGVGREVVRVTLHALADDRVVNGADVVVYGFANGAHVETTRLGAEVTVPDVIGFHIEPQSDNDDERGQRLLRRLGRHRL
jgi:hypothetical protein